MNHQDSGSQELVKFGWLGVAAAIVSLGTAVNLGSFILWGPTIINSGASFEWARVIAPVMASFILSAIAIAWAVFQMKTNIAANQTAQQQTHYHATRLAIVDSLISELADLVVKLHEVSASGNNLATHLKMSSRESIQNDARAVEMFQKNGDSYNRLITQVRRVQIQVVRLKQVDISYDKTNIFFLRLLDFYVGPDSQWHQYQLEGKRYLDERAGERCSLVQKSEEISNQSSAMATDMIRIVSQYSETGDL